MKAVKCNRMTFPPLDFATVLLHTHKPAKMIISLNFDNCIFNASLLSKFLEITQSSYEALDFYFCVCCREYDINILYYINDKKSEKCNNGFNTFF